MLATPSLFILTWSLYVFVHSLGFLKIGGQTPHFSVELPPPTVGRGSPKSLQSLLFPQRNHFQLQRVGRLAAIVGRRGMEQSWKSTEISCSCNGQSCIMLYTIGTLDLASHSPVCSDSTVSDSRRSFSLIRKMACYVVLQDFEISWDQITQLNIHKGPQNQGSV